MNYLDEDATSGSGDDMNMLDGHNKRQSMTPSSSGRRKRSRKATGDAIVDAMLEIAAASKMRAAAIMKNEDRFSISKCIQVLDDMQDVASATMDEFDLELDEMELVAAAAGYYYYNSVSKQPQHSISTSGSGFMTRVLEGHDNVCRQMFRMDKHVFSKLCGTLRQRGMLRDTAGVMIEEQLAIFLNIVGHNERNRVIQERFQHSGETISRHFNNVLKAIKSLSREFLLPPPPNTPPEIINSNRFYPYFKDCLGVIDGMHIPAHVPAKDQSQFRNKKGLLSQNVLAACTFDLQFIFIYPGWEGSAADSRVLRAVLDDPDQNFPNIPEGKYYLVDMDYSNTEGFIAPYLGVRYHVHEYSGANNLPRNAKELFNHRHASLRNVIQQSFSLLKARFPILKLAPQYAFQIQRDIVIAACVLHNFIRREERNDWLFNTVTGVTVEELPYFDDQLDMNLTSSIQEQLASALRESIAAAMWSDFINKWDEW
ncbi:uncharacterized protein LOC123198546 [Mangifera indica]|uniref:uncharacterized protein LOC123198546 n=1 Tax=Mangifera indica TaxID=29780 RepID=UPI001CF9A31D|nr:uncharacterized protein LOC123198546 [Mangifera indica]XP_044469165.1 uncharacterized protein LOC123198546 [Mangifera indica]XP_044469166.1 uncharacterized protein LOC123198546 [Mangifera indica]XP_044469167.1 uncharacterized protein LOC123198546 [Mangifera indica]